MECKTKEMSSYQRLKWEMEQLQADYIQERTKAQIYNAALWKITTMEDSGFLAKAKGIAMDALFKTSPMTINELRAEYARLREIERIKNNEKE